MKKLVFTLFIASMVLSCSDDTEIEQEIFKGTVTASDIEGDWKVTEYYTNDGKIKTKISGQNVTAKFKSSGTKFNNAKVTYNLNPNLVASTGNFTNTTTISYLTFSKTEDRVQLIPLIGKWTIKNNVVTITSNSHANNYTIIDFTENTLKLKQLYDEELDVVSGYQGQAKATYYITVTK